MWLWPPIMQQELDKFCESANSRKVRKQFEKALPSGVSPNAAYGFPERYGGTNCLQTVDMRIVDKILADLWAAKDKATDWGVPKEFAARAAAVYKRIRVRELNMQTVWLVFQAMLPHLL